MRPRWILSMAFVLLSAGCGDACSPAPEPPPPSPVNPTRDPQDPGPDAHPTVKALHSSSVDLDKIFGAPPESDASTD